MMGQDAIHVIDGFNEKLNLTGVILTKLDGDTRGGVALSVRHLTNVPIKFRSKTNGPYRSNRFIDDSRRKKKSKYH